MKAKKRLRAAEAVLCAALFMTAACSEPLEGVMLKPWTPGALSL
jgi:hypothetical protein